MTQTEKNTIADIVRINKYIYKLQDAIEEEQERVINDLSMPAKKTVEILIGLDNRRIDLCNLKVLYGFIERGLGDRFALFARCAEVGADSSLYALAKESIMRAGYSPRRARNEFLYLFKQLGRSQRLGGNRMLHVTEKSLLIQ